MIESVRKVQMQNDISGNLRKQLIHIFLIAVLGFLAYSNTFHSPFQWDEDVQIIHNPVVKDLNNFASDRTGHDYNPRRFVGYLSLALNYYLGGVDVVGYHIVNLLIHISNALLVYFFVLLTFRTPYFSNQQSAISSQQNAKSNFNDTFHESSAKGPHTGGFAVENGPAVAGDTHFLIALFSALLFVSHPLQTQAVTYVIQRFTSLATFFYLLSVVMYIKGRLRQAESDGKNSNPHPQSSTSALTLTWFFLSFVSAVLAMKTKEIAFTLPFVILLYEVIFFKSPVKKMLFILMPFLLTLLIVPLSLMQSDRPAGELLLDISEKTKVQTQMSRWEYLMTEMRVIVTYIRLIFLPINQNLDYDYPIYHSFFTPQVFMSFLFLAVIISIAMWLLYKSRRAISGNKLVVSSKKEEAIDGGPNTDGASLLTTHHSLFTFHYSRLIAFGIFWFFITLAVESSIIPIVDVIFEHRLYLPLAGACIGITTGVLTAAGRLKIEKIAVTALFLMTLLLSGLTYARNAIWNDQISLWQDVAKKSPNKARPHSNLGHAYTAQGQLDRAIAEFQTALDLRSSAQDHYNLGVAYEKKGLTEMAEEQYLIALSVADIAQPHNNLGVLYARSALLDEAIKHFQTAIKLQPDYAIAHNNLGKAYQDKGLTDMAIEQYQLAIKLDPDNPGFRNDLAKAIQSRHGQAEIN